MPNEPSIQVPRWAKLEKVTTSPKSPYAPQSTTHIYFTGEQLVVTNRHSMAVVEPVDIDGDMEGLEGYLPVEAIKEARKLEPRGVLILTPEHVNLTDGRMYPRPQRDDVGKFPNWEKVRETATDREHTYEVSLDAKLLYELAQAMGKRPRDGARVRLRFGDDMDTIYVTCQGAEGFLMPCRL